MFLRFLCVRQLLVKLGPLSVHVVLFKGRLNQKLERQIHPSTFFLFLAILYWRVVELLMPRTKKSLKSVIAETFSSMTPKKAKKPENVIKNYCIIEYTQYEFEFKRANNVNKWILCELIADHTCRFEFELVYSTVQVLSNIVQLYLCK